MLRILTIVIVILLSLTEATAQGPPVFTDTPILLGLEGKGIRVFGKYISRENGATYILPVIVPVNITPKLLVSVMVPFVGKSSSSISGRAGFGDVAVAAKYIIVQDDGKGRTFRIAGKIKETFPTGSTEIVPPLGSGEYQTQFGVVSGFITTEFGVYGEVHYTIITGDNVDNILYNVAFGYPLLPQKYPPSQVNLFLEFNGSYSFESTAGAQFISPAVQWITGRKILIETGIQLPLAEGVPEEQRAEFIYTLGTRILIF